MDREVEAPERFRAIQTYRATMAVLKQQAAFVKSMYNSGVVDDMEEAELLRPIEGRERTLERKGPRYKSPTTLQILHNLPFLRRVPDFITEVLYRHGKLHQYRSGTSLPCGKTKSMFVVTSGILKVSYTDPQGLAQEYFLASGGILNLYSAMTGEALPGKVEAIAEGNALGRGPVVVEFYKSGVDLIRKQALAGDQYYVQIELDLMRLAAIYLTERMKPRLMPFIFTRLSQQFAKQPKQTLPRLHSLLSDDSRFDQDVFPDSGRQKEDMQGMVREAAVQEYTNMRHDLACSEILTLHAGSAYLQRSHMVLLRGTLKVAGQSAPGSPTGGRRDSGVLEYKAPFVFTYIAPSEGEPQNPTRFVAGYHSEQREAVLMVCTPKSGEAIIVTEPEEVGARKSFEGVENEKVPDLKSKTASSSNKSRPPNLRRQSLALILNAGDTGEVSSAQRRKSKQWWDHATRAKLEQRDV